MREGRLKGGMHVQGDRDLGACQIDPRENIFRVFMLATYLNWSMIVSRIL